MMKETTKSSLIAVAITFASIIGVAAVFFLILSLVAPMAMAKLTKDIGMYSTSAWYSSLQYDEGKGEISNIENAMYCAAMAKDEEKVAEYGLAFINDTRFVEYSAKREKAEEGKYQERYSQYVYGMVSIAQYHTDKKSESVNLAISANQTIFEKYNAVTDLVNEVIIKGDKMFAGEILSSLQTLQTSGTIQGDYANNLSSVITNLQAFIA